MRKIRNSKKKQVATAELASPLRRTLKSLYPRWVKSSKDRESLAKYLGQSVSSLSNLAKGEGSLNTWWGLFLWHYQIKAEDASVVAQTLMDTLRKYKPLSEADRLWYELDGHMTQSEKLYCVKVIRVASAIEREIGTVQKEAQ